MGANYVVNKSGSSIPVYDYNDERIGTIYDGEAFLAFGEKMVTGKLGVSIKFLSSRGEIETGAIPSIDEKYRRHMQFYPYGKADVFGNGNLQDVFKMKKLCT